MDWLMKCEGCQRTRHPSWYSWHFVLTVSYSIIENYSGCCINGKIETDTALPSKTLLMSMMLALYIIVLVAGTIGCGQNRQVVGAPALQGRGA